jgi:hypothetical protein
MQKAQSSFWPQEALSKEKDEELPESSCVPSLPPVAKSFWEVASVANAPSGE